MGTFYWDFEILFWSTGKNTALRLSISESFNYNVVFKNCTWNENSFHVSPTQPWAEKIMMSLEGCLLTPLNCIWKRNCTALIYFIISDSILRVEIYYSYYSVFMFLTGICGSRSPYLCVKTYWILCELSIEMYFFYTNAICFLKGQDSGFDFRI